MSNEETYGDLLAAQRRKQRAIEAAYAEHVVANPGEDHDLRLAKFRVANRSDLDELTELNCRVDHVAAQHAEALAVAA